MSNMSKINKGYICNFWHGVSADFLRFIVAIEGEQDDRGHRDGKEHVGVPHQEPTVNNYPVVDLDNVLVHGKCPQKVEEQCPYYNQH